MGDTKRGRERKGRIKRRQRRNREIERAAETYDERVDFEALYEDEIEEIEL